MSLDDSLKQADELHMKEDIKGMNVLLEELLKQNPESPAVKWRLGRCLYLVSKELPTEDKSAQESLIRRGLDLAQDAHKTLAKDASAHERLGVNKWNGILLGRLGDFVSTKEKIGNAFKIKEYFLAAVEAKPDDATIHHCLGTWCYSVWMIGFAERAVASAVFAAPPSATFEETEKHLLKSQEIDSNQISNNLALGKLYYQNSMYADAKKFLSAAQKCPQVTVEAKRQAQEALTLYGKC